MTEGKILVLTTPNKEDTHPGQAFYTKKSLKIYDLIVTFFSNRFVWHCPRTVLIDFFRQNTSPNHLDIGVGTGYFLKQLDLIPSIQRLGLLDLNKDCLEYTKENLKEFNPEIYQHDIYEPFTRITKKFDSVSLNYVLHCIPGTLAQKSNVFDNIKAVLNPRGKLFGSTIIGKGVKRNWLAEKLTRFYNDKKIFSNLDDDKNTLQAELEKRFNKVEIKMQGCVALFVAS